MPNRFQTISVIGLGYIGLPTAAVFAARKVKVIGVDVNEHAVETINKGKVHIVEPDLDIMVGAAVSSGHLRASLTPEPADAFLIAVPTPFKGDHEPDLTYIEAASRAIAPVLKKGDLVILESTSPVGTTEMMADWLAKERPDLSFPQQRGAESDIRIAHCPERVLPGRVLRELVDNDRVIGGMTRACSEAAAALYRIFVQGECVFTNTRTAEMCKLTENSFRDVNIAFANELSLICEKEEIDVWELIKLANRHPRVDILQPGPGVGGHCIAVDPWFIVNRVPAEARLIRTGREVNQRKPQWVLEKVRDAVAALEAKGLDPSSISIAILGLAFKPNIDDLRESPALQIAIQVAEQLPCDCSIVEPNISELPAALKRGMLSTLEDAIRPARIVVSLVAHKEFFDLAALVTDRQIVVDAAGLLKAGERERLSV